MDDFLLEANILFGNPPFWTDGSVQAMIPGMDKENTFYVSSLNEVLSETMIFQNHHVAVLGLNPIGIALAYQLQNASHSVTLLPSGFESTEVQNRLLSSEIQEFFKRHEITLIPHSAKALRGEQIHCQSGYCSFVCEGRFIEEGTAVEHIVTESGNVFVDSVVIADFSNAEEKADVRKVESI